MKTRNYGIDLLRLVLMYMVCLLHTLGQGGILEASVEGSLGYAIFWFMETFACCAVDAFALITGYTASDRPQRYEKYVMMWLQVVFYSFVLSLCLKVIGLPVSLTIKSVVKSVMPVSFKAYWYFTAYTVVFFAMPVINRCLFQMHDMAAKKTLIILVVMFSCMGFLTDPFLSNSGYSAIWILVLYCIGILARKIYLFERLSSSVMLVLWAVCIFVAWGGKVIFGRMGFINYVAPTILLSAIIMVVLFSRLRLSGTIISKIAPLAFGVYLFQNNSVIWEQIKGKFAFVAQMPVGLGVSCVLGIAFGIFTVGIIVEAIRKRLETILHIPALSKKIVWFADQILEKISTLVL